MGIQFYSTSFLLVVMTLPFLSLPSNPTLFFIISAARKKKCFKSTRKSKWSTGVLKKRQPKKTASTSSSSMSSVTSSDSNGIRGGSVSADQSSSTLSDSSDEDRNTFLTINRNHHAFKLLQKRLQQVYNPSSNTPKISPDHRQQNKPSKSDPARRKALTEFYLKKLGVFV